MSNLKKLYNKCEKFNIISFDIFDTLLKRDVMSPSDVFKIVEIDFDKKFNKKSDFAKKRQEAEELARKNSKYDEISFDEVYDFLTFSKDEKRLLKQLELCSKLSFMYNCSAT